MKHFIPYFILIIILFGCKDNATNPVNNKVQINIYDNSRVLNSKAWFNDTTRTAFMECTFVKNSSYSLIVKVFENDKDSANLFGGGTFTFSSPVTFEYKPKTYIGRLNFKVSEITAWGYDSVSIYPTEIKLLAEAIVNYD